MDETIFNLPISFVAKHLPDKFYHEGDQRRSPRTIIFRELAAKNTHAETMFNKIYLYF